MLAEIGLGYGNKYLFMKITISDRLIAYLALLSGLSISAVAIYYSVAGLISIFAAAVIPIAVMGIVLEVGKLSATVWLKQNWSIAPRFLKTYLLIAIAVLMLITSMGIFGYLSKAHLDQAVPTGDVAAKVALLDEKIKTERENIDAARRALKQMDDAVDQTMARSTTEQGAGRAAQLRRQQQAERTKLQKDISVAQGNISKLNEERAPIAAELRKVEAEVGPIKYVAALIYGDNPDNNLLERAVRWMIIIIVLVFDPLAVILLLASQYSFQWFRKKEESEEVVEEKAEPSIVVEEPVKETVEPFIGEVKEESILDKHPYLNSGKSFWDKPEGWVSVPPQVYKPEEAKDDFLPTYEEITPKDEPIDEDDEDELNHPDDSAEIKAAKTQWKHDHPNDSLKRHKRLFEQGIIKKLPWEDYLLKAKPDFEEIKDEEAAIEAAKWAAEQLDSKKKDNDLDRARGESTGQEKQGSLAGYVQNAEQSESTIWQRVKKTKEE